MLMVEYHVRYKPIERSRLPAMRSISRHFAKGATYSLSFIRERTLASTLAFLSDTEDDSFQPLTSALY